MELRLRYNERQLKEFADQLIIMSEKIGMKVSSRGWAYLMEQSRMINKDQFDKVSDLINKCRKKGYLPIDFVAEESERAFKGIETFEGENVYDRFIKFLGWSSDVHSDLQIEWWKDEEYYIQMVVEKVDLVNLFQPVCRHYKIPIANSRGWSSILQRAEYARRYKEAQDLGLKCVLLYCGDHDPDGLRIGEFIRKNLEDLKDVMWSDEETGYNPSDLIIDRFGLNYDFIIKNDFTWIDNLITGSGRNLASPNHKNFKMPYVQKYLKDVGERKCEANVIVTEPIIARDLCRSAIDKYLGIDAYSRFLRKRDDIKKEFESWKEENEIDDKIDEIIDLTSKTRPD